MKEDMFIFERNPLKCDLNIIVPKGISSKIELLEFYGENLCFPDYYGVNWDALSDCIEDLSWLNKKNILITHLDIPLSNNRKLAKTYISILQWAVNKWRDSLENTLQISFPTSFKDEIILMLHELELEGKGTN